MNERDDQIQRIVIEPMSPFRFVKWCVKVYLIFVAIMIGLAVIGFTPMAIMLLSRP